MIDISFVIIMIGYGQMLSVTLFWQFMSKTYAYTLNHFLLPQKGIMPGRANVVFCSAYLLELAVVEPPQADFRRYARLSSTSRGPVGKRTFRYRVNTT